MKMKIRPDTIRNMFNFILGRPCPLLFVIYITNRCNSRCEYCSVWKHERAVKYDMDTASAKMIGDCAVRMGAFQIGVTGGEPLMRNDIAEILEYYHEIGLHVHLITNGLLFPKKFDEIKDHVDAWEFSIDSTDPNIHDKNRGIKGTFDKVMESIDLVKPLRKPIWFGSTVTRLSAETVCDLADFAREIGAIGVFSPVMSFTDDKSHTPATDNMDVPAIRKAMIRLWRMKRNGNHAILNTEASFDYIFSNRIIPCRRFTVSIQFDHAGNLIVNCPHKQQKRRKSNSQFNIRKISPEEVFHGKIGKVVRKQDRHCRDCRWWCEAEPSMLLNKDIRAFSGMMGMIKTVMKS